eukprot:6197534-Prymnesium_polylepis.4
MAPATMSFRAGCARAQCALRRARAERDAEHDERRVEAEPKEHEGDHRAQGHGRRGRVGPQPQVEQEEEAKEEAGHHAHLHARRGYAATLKALCAWRRPRGLRGRARGAPAGR